MRGASFFAEAGPVSHDACRRRRENERRKGEELRRIIIIMDDLMREEGKKVGIPLRW